MHDDGTNRTIACRSSSHRLAVGSGDSLELLCLPEYEVLNGHHLNSKFGPLLVQTNAPLFFTLKIGGPSSSYKQFPLDCHLPLLPPPPISRTPIAQWWSKDTFIKRPKNNLLPLTSEYRKILKCRRLWINESNSQFHVWIAEFAVACLY